MGKDVLLGPAGKIEQGSRRQEVEARLGQGRSILPRQSLVELLLELVQVANVARGIFALGFGQLIGAQSLVCCCFDTSILSSSLTRSLSPWRSV